MLSESGNVALGYGVWEILSYGHPRLMFWRSGPCGTPGNPSQCVGSRTVEGSRRGFVTVTGNGILENPLSEGLLPRKRECSTDTMQYKWLLHGFSNSNFYTYLFFFNLFIDFFNEFLIY